MRRNPLTIVLALAALVLAMTAPAVAQDAQDEYIAEAVGDGYSIEFFGEVTDESIFGGVTEVEVASDPSADAFGVGNSLAEDSASDASVSSEGSDSDEGCAVPDLDEQLQFVGDLLNSCSSAEVAIADGLPSASAQADGLLLRVSGDILADILAQVFLGLEPITDGIDEGIGQLEEAVLEPVTLELTAACEEALAEAGEGFNELREALGAITDELPDDFDELIDLLSDPLLDEEACALLLNVITTPPSVGEVLNALVDALDGLELLRVDLASSESEAEALADVVDAIAGATGLDVSLPSLAALGDALETVLNALVGEFVDEVIERYIEPLDELSQNILPEELSQFLSPILGLDILDDDTPILAITAGNTSATASFDRATGDVTADATAVALVVSISEVFAALFGQDATLIEVEEGGEQVIFEDTPLESRLAAGFTTIDEDAERDGMPGATATSEAMALSLIQFDEGEWVLDIAAGQSFAAAFGQVGEAVEAPPLPITGGGFALLAVAMLAAGLLLRRRD